MYPLYSREYKFIAILGDLKHKSDIYLLAGNFGPDIEAYFTAVFQAQYLKNHKPELVPPPDAAGHPPSDHTVSTVFEYHYYTDPYFASVHLEYIRHIIPRALLHSFVES